MKKKVYALSSIFILAFIGFGVYYITQVKAEANHYYSEENNPEFYGLTKAIIQKGDKFSLTDTRFRIFAKDFEDGDLTQKITVTSNVDTSQVGNYEIHYSVTDSHGNKTDKIVPIEVIDDLSQGRYYERTLYSLPSVFNLALAGTNRGNNHDRQILGFYMEENSKIEVKKINGKSNLTLTLLNNDSATEKTFTIQDEYQEITLPYKSVPFIKTSYEEDSIVIGIRITDDSGVEELPYYHYQDDEILFTTKWHSNIDSYSVIESEDITTLVPYLDRDRLHNNFSTFDKYLEYWHKVITTYDEYLGLSFNPEEAIDQNVKTKYFIKANKHGAGAAYYAWDHVAVNSESVFSFFYANWGGLHEVGHGYQGSLANAGMDLGEVSNNILGHYVQMNQDIYPFTSDWLGKIPNIEKNYSKIRLEGNSFSDLSLSGRLYVLVNLLDTYDPKETYATINKIWRKNIRDNENLTAADAYVLAFYQLYDVNIVSYFESWKVSVSPTIKKQVSGAKTLYYLSDLIQDDTLEKTIQSDLDKEGVYSLVSTQELEKYELKGNASLQINIDDINQLKGKKIIVQNGNWKKEFTIENNTVELKDLAIGVYEIILPVPNKNTYTYSKYNYLVVQNNGNTNVTYDYQNGSDITLATDSKIYLKGLGNDIFANITFSEQKNMTVTTYNRAPHVYFNDIYSKIEIYDLNNQLVYQKEFIGSQTYPASQDSIPYEYGYKLVIQHREGVGRLVIQSQLLDKSENLLTIAGENIYYIGQYGLYQEENTQYENYITKLEEYASKLENDLTEEEFNHKESFPEKKSQLLIGILKLNDKDKENYLKQYVSIYNGGTPNLIENSLTVKQGDIVDLYTLLKATDLEDGEFCLTTENAHFSFMPTKETLPGIYKIDYQITDTDSNITEGILTLTILKQEIDKPNDDISTDDDSNNNMTDNNVSDNESTNDVINNNVNNNEKPNNNENNFENTLDNAYPSNNDITVNNTKSNEQQNNDISTDNDHNIIGDNEITNIEDNKSQKGNTFDKSNINKRNILIFSGVVVFIIMCSIVIYKTIYKKNKNV